MKINAHGTVLNLGDSLTSPTFTQVAQVETFDGPEISRGTQDVPTHDDTGFIQRLANALAALGVISGTILYDPVDSTHDASTGLVSLAESGAERPFQFVFPDAASTQWDLDGFVTRFRPTGMDANTGLMRADFEITPSGDNITLA